VLADLKGGPSADFAMLSVAMREIRSMHEGQSESPGAPLNGSPAQAGSGKVKSKPKAGNKAKAKAKAAGKAAQAG